MKLWTRLMILSGAEDSLEQEEDSTYQAEVSDVKKVTMKKKKKGCCK